VSRYLVQLARETRSKLRPPSGLRLSPRAPALFDEVHEERLVPPPTAFRETTVAPASPVAEQWTPRRVADNVATPMNVAPSIQPPSPRSEFRAPSLREARIEAPLLSRPAKFSEPPAAQEPAARTQAPGSPTPMTERAPRPTAVAKSEALAGVQGQPRPEPMPEISETRVRAMSFLVDDGQTTKQTKVNELGIPETVRAWLAASPQQSEPAAPRSRPQALFAAAASRQMSKPAVEVTIGTVEVTIESDPVPPLRATRRSEPRVAAPRHAPQMPGGLARQYLDR
jgi:hypothetical protein